jgi:hypothetical protein
MKRFSLGVIVTAVLIAGAVMAHAQRVPPPPPSGDSGVVAGGDLGFRILRMDGDKPVGELVIRRNAPGGGTMWVPVDLGGRGGVHPLTLK